MSELGAQRGHAFLSYVREDSDEVVRLQRHLEAAGIPVWRDTDSLWPGQDWRTEIHRAITGNVIVFIACFSSSSLARDKTFQNEELILAIEELRRRVPGTPWLIPVRFDDCEVPDIDIGGGRTLTQLQRVDLFGDGYDDAVWRLIETITRLIGKPAIPPTPAAVKSPAASAASASPKTGPKPITGEVLLSPEALMELREDPSAAGKPAPVRISRDLADTFVFTRNAAPQPHSGQGPSSVQPPPHEGTVVAWGANNFGQCNVPHGLAGVTSVAAGGDHSLALTSKGTVRAWGNNTAGQCNVPDWLNGIAAVSAGYMFSLVLTNTGTVAAWGQNNFNQCSVPPGLNSVTAIAAGFDHSLAVTRNGTVVAWGDNEAGQCDVPHGLTGVIAVSAGLRTSFAVTSEHVVLGWGSGLADMPNEAKPPGALDRMGGAIARKLAPSKVPPGVTGVIEVVAGWTFALALTGDGTVIPWGYFISHRRPFRVGRYRVPTGLTGVIAIAAGANHSLVLTADGAVIAWGHNGSDQCKVPSTLSGGIAIAAGASHSLAVTSVISTESETGGYQSGEIMGVKNRAVESNNGGYKHYIDEQAMYYTISNHKPVSALCGWRWIPSRSARAGDDLNDFPVCPRCETIFNSLP